MQYAEVRVWDPFIRISHWLLATAVLVDWLIEKPLWLHSWLGYLAAALVLLRVVWGFVGPENARFTSFLRGPRLVVTYLVDLLRFSSKRYLGHSPAGGAMIVALLIMVAATAGTGMILLAQDKSEGPLTGVIAKVERPTMPGQRRPRLLMKSMHETLGNVTLMLIMLHIGGVALASVVHRENLVRAMITGRKRA